MAQNGINSVKAAAEAGRIARIAGQNLKELLNSFKNCIQVVQKTKRMLEVDPKCICVDFESKWERRRELYEVAEFIEATMEFLFRNKSVDDIVASLVDTTTADDLPESEVEVAAGKLGSYYLEKRTFEDDGLLWCDRVCVLEKVDMDSSLWCNLPQTIIELVFARLPFHQIFQLRVLSKHWRSLLTSATFQNAFSSTASRRFAFVAGTDRKRLWTFGTTERRWYTLPFDFLPRHYDVPIAGDGGLLCCRRPGSVVKTGHQAAAVQDLQLYVCNPFTQTWKQLPHPSYVEAFNLVHLVMDRQTKQYTITVVDDAHCSEVKAKVEVYDSTTNTWNAGGGIFKSSGNNLIYYKDYMAGEFRGIRAYDKNTGYTGTSIDVSNDIYFSEVRGFFPLVEYEGQIYLLQTESGRSGIWVLQGPNHKWHKICSIPKPETLKFYLFSLYVSRDVIFIFGDRRTWYDEEFEEDPDMEDQPPIPPYMWMLDRSRGNKWINMVDHELDLISFSEIMFEMRMDDIP